MQHMYAWNTKTTRQSHRFGFERFLARREVILQKNWHDIFLFFFSEKKEKWGFNLS